jgi:hypothetical protein
VDNARIEIEGGHEVGGVWRGRLFWGWGVGRESTEDTACNVTSSNQCNHESATWPLLQPLPRLRLWMLLLDLLLPLPLLLLPSNATVR